MTQSVKEGEQKDLSVVGGVGVRGQLPSPPPAQLHSGASLDLFWDVFDGTFRGAFKELARQSQS